MNVSCFQLFCSCARRRSSAAPVAGRPPFRLLDVRRSGSWTSASPSAGHPPLRRLDVRRLYILYIYIYILYIYIYILHTTYYICYTILLFYILILNLLLNASIYPHSRSRWHCEQIISMVEIGFTNSPSLLSLLTPSPKRELRPKGQLSS